ncbi:DUF4260 domain-containing protein [Chryseosolibacter indicus]|uniref:DUF4260 family protein n=1 Tax=Chryseosolibacter indicus TaxID=2782351 RepID=A0ABS5VYI0_9BACT|nr:DUF4260 domain-containing protein [Chryseosolibacter indicus]MBT1705920.1 DUF4260 family protein [Chryseosolibacter indicus]
MKNLLRFEEAFMFLLSIYLTSLLPYKWWLFWAWLLVPDLSFVAYAVNAKTGAFFYNLFHHKGIAIAIYILGLYLASEPLQFVGLLLFGHSSMDRMFGYGLKYADNFHNTHLGWIGNHQNG